jgi:hypothetical protein
LNVKEGRRKGRGKAMGRKIKGMGREVRNSVMHFTLSFQHS